MKPQTSTGLTRPRRVLYRAGGRRRRSLRGNAEIMTDAGQGRPVPVPEPRGSGSSAATAGCWSGRGSCSAASLNSRPLQQGLALECNQEGRSGGVKKQPGKRPKFSDRSQVTKGLRNLYLQCWGQGGGEDAFPDLRVIWGPHSDGTRCRCSRLEEERGQEPKESSAPAPNSRDGCSSTFPCVH